MTSRERGAPPRHPRLVPRHVVRFVALKRGATPPVERAEADASSCSRSCHARDNSHATELWTSSRLCSGATEVGGIRVRSRSSSATQATQRWFGHNCYVKGVYRPNVTGITLAQVDACVATGRNRRKGKPAARRGRKATGPTGSAELPNDREPTCQNTSAVPPRGPVRTGSSGSGESPRGFRRLGTLGRLGSCLGTRRRGIRLS